MAYDGARHEVVLFGGSTGQGDLADTWTWNGERWTLRSPAHSPSPRAYSEMAYDQLHHRVVLFGGRGPDSGPLTDTWLWDGIDWTQATPAFTPAPTIDEGMTFFSGTGTVLMYSGNFAGPTHLYSWDGSNWTDLQTTGGPPASAYQAGFSVDPRRPVVILLAYDVNQTTLQHWEFDGRAWTHRAIATPSKRSLVQTVADERDHTIVLFGGTGHNDTWTWDGARWTQQQPKHSPSVRSGTGPTPGMAYDGTRGEVVVFGGYDGKSGPLADTWTWNGRDWTSS
jgi:hypothetical protein